MIELESLGYVFGTLMGGLLLMIGKVVWNEKGLAERRRLALTLSISGVLAILAGPCNLASVDRLAMVLMLSSMSLYTFVHTEAALKMLLSEWKKVTLMLFNATVTAFLAALAVLRAIELQDTVTEEWQPTIFTAGWFVAMTTSHCAITLACFAEVRYRSAN